MAASTEYEETRHAEEKSVTETATESSEASSEESTVQLPKTQRAILCIALALGVFLISIDETVIVTAIPRITDDFRTIRHVGWYGSA